MSTDAAYLGIDLGTSGLKLSLLDSAGEISAEAEEPYAVRTPAPGRAETDPADWLAAVHRAGMRLSSSDARLAAIGVTGQMHGVVLSDQEGQPLRPALLWPDQRAVTVLEQWHRLPESARSRLGNPLVPGMAGPLLTWLNAHETASVDAAALVTSPKDWLRGRLTGDTVTERSDASATLLWDVVADGWSIDALSVAGISQGLLPALVASDAVVGTSDFLGEEAPVVAGAADTAAALVALKGTQTSDAWSRSLVVNVGTGIQIVRPEATAEPRTDPITHLYADADDGWYEMLAIQNGGMALSWVQTALDVTWADLVALAKVSVAGAEGALFVPFLTGERGGLARPGSTAGWSCLTTSTGRAQLARSAFEAFAFSIRLGIDLLGGHDGQVLLSGGGGRDPWIRQLIADVLNLPVSFLHLRSASAMGAAVLAARGVGFQLQVPAAVAEVVASAQTRRKLDVTYERWLSAVRSA